MLLSGGNFNKLRKKQIFLEQLLKDNVEGYIGSDSKREYVKEMILDKIPGGLKVSTAATCDSLCSIRLPYSRSRIGAIPAYCSWFVL